MGELEKLGPKFRVALRIARDPRFERLKCTHKGLYADDCLVERVKMVRARVSLAVVCRSRLPIHHIQRVCAGFRFVA